MENLTISKEKQEALELHQQILFSAERAVSAYVETCKGLKRMRDTKLYIELGFETFEDYSEKAVGIKQRQAYYYISTLEKLGEPFLQSNANLGPSKLALLTEIPLTEREQFVEENDLAGMTVEKVKELVAENNAKGEQIEMLTDERDSIREERDEVNTELSAAEKKISELEKELEEVKSKPTEVAVQEPDEETLERIRTEEREAVKKEFEKTSKTEKKELKEKLKAEQEKAVAEATQKAQKELEEYKAKVAEAESASAQALERAEQLQKQLAVSSSPEATKFSFFFDAVNADFEKMIDSLKKLKEENPEVAEKYAGAMKKYYGIIADKFKAIGFDITDDAKMEGTENANSSDKA